MCENIPKGVHPDLLVNIIEPMIGESMGDFSHNGQAAMLTSVEPDLMTPVYKVGEQFGEGLFASLQMRFEWRLWFFLCCALYY